MGARAAPADLRCDPFGRRRRRAAADAGARDLDEPPLRRGGRRLAANAPRRASARCSFLAVQHGTGSARSGIRFTTTARGPTSLSIARAAIRRGSETRHAEDLVRRAGARTWRAADDDASIVIEAAPAATRAARHPLVQASANDVRRGRTREAPTTRAARSRRRGHGPARATCGLDLQGLADRSLVDGVHLGADRERDAVERRRGRGVPVQFGEEGRGAAGERNAFQAETRPDLVDEISRRRLLVGARDEDAGDREVYARVAASRSTDRAARVESERQLDRPAPGPTTSRSGSAATSGTLTCCAPSIGSDVTLIPIGGTTRPVRPPTETLGTSGSSRGRRAHL